MEKEPAAAVRALGAAARLPRLGREIAKHRFLYLLMLPAIAALFIFSYMPIGGLVLAFKQFKFNMPLWAMPWVGLDNFRAVFNLPEFWTALRNTLIISLGKLVTFFPVPIILAVLISELRFRKLNGFVQTVLFLPHFLSWVVMSGVFIGLFSVSIGVWGKLASLLDLPKVVLLGNTAVFRPLLYATNVFKEAGFSMIIYLAAIAGIDPQLYEAARMDGASKLQQIRFIVLPGIRFAVLAMLILEFGYLMEAGFDQVFNLYSAAVYSVGDILDTFVYRFGISKGKFAMTTAVGFFKSAINCLLILAAQRVIRRMSGQHLF
jgi:putative aldouronate transport system permease protein